jgi:ABC-type branched-subunit amino acid transport system substrate-binding protein
MYRPRFLFLVLLGCLSGLVSGTAHAEDIVVGMSAAFTGPSRGLGIELYRGSMACFEEVNREEGGIRGRKIVLKARDDEYNPGPAIENTIRFLDKEEVFCLFNYVGTPTTTRCLPLLKRNRHEPMLLFCPFTGAQPQRQPPYDEVVFNLRASYYEETGGLVKNFLAIGRKRIAVFYQIDAYGRNGWAGVRIALAERGLKMVGEATYERGARYRDSMKEQVDILRKTDADAVICVGAYAASAAFIRDARDAGWDVPIANISFVGSENLLGLLQEAGKTGGKDYTQNLINSQVVPNYHDEALPAIAEYRKLMTKHDPQLPREIPKEDYKPLDFSFVSLEGFLNARLLVAILRKMDAPFDRKRLRDAAEALNDFDLGIGVNVSFSPQRHQASDRVYYTVVREGRFETLDDWKRWSK